VRTEIAGRAIGDGEPVYVVAEAGSNHDGSLDRALALIDVAAEARADAVKFQSFRADDLYPRSAGSSDYLHDERSIHQIIRELEMPPEWLPALAARCRERGIALLSTPFDETSADLLDPFVPAFKIASYEMTHHPLIQHVARLGKPLIVSTGTADLAEVGEMLDAVAATGAAMPIVLQCTASYPAPLDALNLRALRTIRERYGVLTGLSDHSREPLPAPLAAVALGACLIEKHFTLDNDLPGPDHVYAVEPHELRAVVEGVRAVERALGTGTKAPRPEEAELRAFARRSIFSRRPIAAGELLTRDNIAVLRCGKLPPGLHPREYPRLLGRRAARPIAVDTALGLDDVE
jgi:N-acetylneuraminate synthase